MKTLFATLLLVVCGVAQANVEAHAVKVSAEPVWLKDMQVLNCRFGACVNETAGGVEYTDGVVDGYTVIFPGYSEERLKEISPAVIKWIDTHGIPHQ